MPDPVDQPPTILRSFLEAAIIQRAIADGAFWQALLSDANAALAQYFGQALPAGITVQAVAEDATTYCHVIPDPAYFPQVAGVGRPSIDPRESFAGQTNYLLSSKTGDPDTSGSTMDELRQALVSAQEDAATTAATAESTAVQAFSDARIMEAAYADWQQALMTSQAAADAAAADPDNADLQQAASDAAADASSAETDYNTKHATATTSQRAADQAEADDDDADEAVDAATRALFQAGFDIDPVTTASEAFNTVLPFNDTGDTSSVASAEAAFNLARTDADAKAATANTASQQAVAAARAAAQSPDDSSLQDAAAQAQADALTAATAASQAAQTLATATTTLLNARAAMPGSTLRVLDEAADDVLYIVLPYAPHRSTFMGPYSLQFDGTASAVEQEATPLLMPQTKMTIEVWMQSPGFDSSRGDVLVSAGNSTSGWSLYASGGVPVFSLALKEDGNPASTTLLQPASGRPALIADTWHYIACMYDGAHMWMYVDGQVVGQAAASGAIVPFNGPLTLGNESQVSDSTSAFLGMLHEVRVWGDALTPGQIASSKFEIHAPGDIVDTPDTALLVQYEFLEGAGFTTADSSGHNHDLDLVNATWVNTGLKSPA